MIVDGQKGKKKWKFEREDKRKTKKEDRIGRKEGFLSQAFRGNKIEKKTLKLQENTLFGPLCKTKVQKYRKTKTKPPPKKTDQNNTFLHFGKQALMFDNCLLCKLHSFMSAKLCLLNNTIKIVFSAEHSFSVSQLVKPPFEAPSQNGTFATNSAILGFPLCLLKPLFLKQIVATKMRFFPSEHK